MIKLYYKFIERMPEDYGCQLLHYGFVGPHELGQIEMLHKDFGFWPLIRLLFRGERCYAIKKDGKILSFLMIGTYDLNFWGTKMKLKTNEAHLFYAWTLEEYRNQGLAQSLRYKTYELLTKEGRDTYYSFTEYDNKPALRLKEKLGVEKIALYLYVQLWRLRVRFKLKSYDTV